jgi:DNA-binding response OmpR family regulator
MIEFERQTTVLVAEDEPPMLGLLEKVLKQHDFRVLVASDGEQAIDVYRSNSQEIDVVLLDMGLPKIGGLDVLLEMKAQNPDVRVVMVSGFFEPTLKSNLSKAGIKHFLAKPYSLNEVVETLRDSLKEH